VGEPGVSLSEGPEEQGDRRTKRPGVGGELPITHEPSGTQTEEVDKVLGSERQAKRPERGTGQW
jgi:hypothetical protein